MVVKVDAVDTVREVFHGSDIKTYDSELRGQEEAGCMRQTSELFTGRISKCSKGASPN